MASVIEQIGAGIGALWAKAVPYVGRFPGAAQLAIQLIVPVFRTAGFFQNKLWAGLSPQERFVGGVTSGWPAPVNPLLMAFLSGVAYENKEELAEGWLSTFGELMLKDVVETDISNILDAAEAKDFLRFFDALAEYTSDETGLESVAAFFRGMAQAASDWEALTGFAIPWTYLGDLVIWLDDTLKGIFDTPPFRGDPGHGREEGLWDPTVITPPSGRITQTGIALNEEMSVPMQVAQTVGTVVSELTAQPTGGTYGFDPGIAEHVQLTSGVFDVAHALVQPHSATLAGLLKLGKNLPPEVIKKVHEIFIGGMASAIQWLADAAGGGGGDGDPHRPGRPGGPTPK